MTIALIRGNKAFKSFGGGKREEERTDNGNKFRNFFSQEDLHNTSHKSNDTAFGTLENRVTDSSCLEMTDAATETYFPDGIGILTDNNSTAQWPFSDFSHSTFSAGICPACGGDEAAANVVIHISDRSFNTHKCSVVSKSGYLRRKFANADEIEIPGDFPGCVETFKLVLDFCKGSTILLEPSNIAALRCAAEYLEMDEKQCRQNLSDITDKYLNEVVLQSWADTSKVLQKCAYLIPLAENISLVSRCIDSLAFIACVECLEHEEREEPKLCQTSESHFWSGMQSGTVTEFAPVWWIADLVNLPQIFFGTLIRAFRKQGMSERHVSLIIVKCTESWLFGDWLHQDDCSQMTFRRSKLERCSLLEDIVRLLPFVKRLLPVAFLFSLVRCAILLEASPDCRMHLENRIASQLEYATVHDFLLPSESSPSTVSRLNLDTMVRIFSIFAARNDLSGMDCLSSQEISAVTKAWDEYVAHICTDPTIEAVKFADLVDVMPGHFRLDHDQLYNTISTFLKAHPYLSQEERSVVCRSLVCLKLSQEACIHAVQNEFMPLRMIVQAMFAQHLQTRRVLNQQLRMLGGVNFESLPPSGQIVSPHRRTKSRLSRNDPFRLEHSGDIASDSNFSAFRRSPVAHVAHLQAKFFRSDLEETNDRLNILEEELAQMRLALSEAWPRNGHCAQQTSSADSNFHGLEAASNLFNSRNKRGLSFKQAGMQNNSHRSSRVGRKLVRSILQKIGFSRLCKSSNDKECRLPKITVIDESCSEASEKTQSQADTFLQWDNGMAFHPSMELKATKQAGHHSRHHSVA